MARKNTVVKLSDDDYESSGGRRLAPGGTYVCRISKESKAKDMSSGRGAEVRLTVIGPKKAKKHFGVNFFDNIAPTVTWKIAQILGALGLKKKEVSFPDGFLKLIVGKEVRVSVRVKNDEEYGKQNKINQYLPATEGADAASMDEDDEEDEDDLDEDLDEDTDDEDEDEDEDEDDDSDDDDDDDESDDDEDEDEEDEDEDEDDEDDDEDEDDLDEDDLDEDDLDDDDEEDEEEKPKRGKAKPKAKPKAKAKRGRSR